jgi:long-chain fatty acid transport protein
MSRYSSYGALAALSASLILAVASDSQASPVLELTGAPAQTMSLSARSASRGPSAAYFNPALLLHAPGGGVTAGVFGFEQRLAIRLDDRPSGVDISGSIYDARRVGEDGTTHRLRRRPLPTDDVPRGRGSADANGRNLYLSVGSAVHLVEDRVVLGLYGVVPTATFQAQRPHFVDEREQYFSNSLHFELLGDRTEMNAFALGLGVRVFDGLDLGAGVTMTSDARSTNPLYVPDAADQSDSYVNTSVEVESRFVPHAGIDVRLWEPMALTATVHAPYDSRVEARSELQLWGYPYEDGEDSLEQSFDFVYGYEPLRASLGSLAAWKRRPGHRIEASAEVLWKQWSTYEDRHGDRPTQAWRDTVTMGAGLRSVWSEHRVGVDARFAPSPVPDQAGRTNYVDNDRLALSAGWEAEIDASAVDLTAALTVQGHRLLERHTVKQRRAAEPVVDEFPNSVDARSDEPIPESRGLQTNNPGFPGYTSSGWLLGLGASLTAQF